MVVGGGGGGGCASTCGTYYHGCHAANAPHSQGKQFKELFIISGTQQERERERVRERECGEGRGSISIFKLPQKMTKQIFLHSRKKNVA